MRGIRSFGVHIPYFRLRRAAIGAALGGPPGSGTRAVASYDEDSTSMAVEAGRAALASDRGSVRSVLFATATPPYLDKTNATAIHAALGFDQGGFAADMTGAIRSGTAALLAGLAGSEPTLVVMSDVRSGLPGSADERDCGDGAVAFVVGDLDEGEIIAEHLGGASATVEFLDRWRKPGDDHSQVWEERFGEFAYLPLVEPTVVEALKAADVAAERVDLLVVTGLHARAVRQAANAARLPQARFVDNLAATVGNTGTAHPGLMLAAALEQAEPGQVIAVVVVGDGVDVLVFRATEAVAGFRPYLSLASQIAHARDDLSYQAFLTWRGFLHREPPRRPEPNPPAAPPSFRNEAWKFAFNASRCAVCGTRHLPPQRICFNCDAVDQMLRERLAGSRGRLVTFAVDHLMHSLNPPAVSGVIDFEEGGRYQCELTDIDPDALRVGDEFEMTFRRAYTVNNVHNYVWKARPIRKVT